MAAAKWVTLRSQWLGQQLRELREANGLILKDAAEYLQRDPATVSRFETGGYPIRRPDLLALLDLYGVADPRRREEFIRLSQEVWKKGWWDGYAGEVTGSLVDFVWLESRSREIRGFDGMTLPGLFQTPRYARVVISTVGDDADEAQIDRWVRFRMGRQKILDGDNPPRVMSIIDEAVLRREVGGRECQAEQLCHLADQAARPNVEIRVLPFSVGVHASAAGAFRIFTLGDGFPGVGYVETPKGAIYVESPDSESFVKMYEETLKLTLSPEKSVEFIIAIAEELSR
ncbi:helix-turn-helix transcriptional regulator [Streptosporangium sp. NPDC020145]|uniref:Helix-turn-helix domain-containing protein n=1 Tax=Streptosporangium jomthongense TaxID=1193683 RepID=A0ABV8F9D9_9ACTN